MRGLYHYNQRCKKEVVFLAHSSQESGKMAQTEVLRSSLRTCNLVADQFAGFNLSDATEEAAELLLGHVLWKVVDNEVGLAVVVCRPGLHGRGAAAAVSGWAVACVASSAWSVCHRSLHVTDDLREARREWEKTSRWTY